LLIADGFRPDVCFTSVLRRGIDTLRIALLAMGLASVPIVESWYLNERHFGALQGLGRLEAFWRYGPRQVWACQHRYAAPPPALALDDPRHPSRDGRYAGLEASELPVTESLRDTVDRIRPFWTSSLAPELRKGSSVLVVGHKNSLRALVRLLDAVPDEEVPRLPIRTGRPLLFALDKQLSVVGRRYLDAPALRSEPGPVVERSASLRDA
jgi:2,3-bisphosphoglycerate-dependent phosphoglycerate mutase